MMIEHIILNLDIYDSLIFFGTIICCVYIFYERQNNNIKKESLTFGIIIGILSSFSFVILRHFAIHPEIHHEIINNKYYNKYTGFIN